MDLARIRQWCDEDNWHIEGFRNVDIIAENGRELALCASPSIARRLREGRQYVKELLAALDGVDALVKAARELDAADGEVMRRIAMTRKQRAATPPDEVRGIYDRRHNARVALRAALTALDGEPK